MRDQALQAVPESLAVGLKGALLMALRCSIFWAYLGPRGIKLKTLVALRRAANIQSETLH
jgi:hypothetical protein